MFNERELTLIEKYFSENIAKRATVVAEKMNNENDNLAIKITNTGMVSSGKSSLFNVLIDESLNKEDTQQANEETKEPFFKTGAARTTMSADKFLMEDVEYIDTPGIDVKEEDDKIAYETIMNSDIIMMIHNIKTGPLHRSEADWLKLIVDNIGDTQMVEKRLIFICSWNDTREKEDDYEELIADLKQLVFDICKVEIPFFRVSVKKYLAGKERNNEKLITGSHVLELKDYLADYAKGYQEQKTVSNYMELKGIIRDMINDFRPILSDFDSKCNKNSEIAKRNYDNKVDIYSTNVRTLASYKVQLEEIQNQIQNVN